jgi:hypothetical protein
MRVFRESYSFVDALKPESPGVPLLLAYLDPRLAIKQLPGTSTLGARAWVRGLRRRLQHGPVLGPPPPASANRPPGEIDLLAGEIDLLAGALFDALATAERTDATLAAIADWLAGHDAPVPGTLASHGGGRYLLRAALRRLGRDGTAFDQGSLDDDDHAIIAVHLPDGCGPRVAIAGHTHAARYVELDAERTYINTGTWSDLIPWPKLGSDEDAKAFIDDLAANRVTATRLLTWALVDEAGPQLRRA